MGTGIWEDKATLRVCKENENDYTPLRLSTPCQRLSTSGALCAKMRHVSDNIFVQVRRTIRPSVHVSSVGVEALILGWRLVLISKLRRLSNARNLLYKLILVGPRRAGVG